MPESKVKMQGLELVSLAISIWSTGGHRIACKSNFSSIPTDHDNYIVVNDRNENNSKYEVCGYTTSSLIQHEQGSVVRNNKLGSNSQRSSYLRPVF